MAGGPYPTLVSAAPRRWWRICDDPQCAGDRWAVALSLDTLLVAGFSSRDFQIAVDLGSRELPFLVVARQMPPCLASLLVACQSASQSFD